MLSRLSLTFTRLSITVILCNMSYRPFITGYYKLIPLTVSKRSYVYFTCSLSENSHVAERGQAGGETPITWH